MNAVIALDVDYKGSKRATITVWRPEYVTVDGVEEFQTTAVIEAQVRSTPWQNIWGSATDSRTALSYRLGTSNRRNSVTTIAQRLRDGGALARKYRSRPGDHHYFETALWFSFKRWSKAGGTHATSRLNQSNASGRFEAPSSSNSPWANKLGRRRIFRSEKTKQTWAPKRRLSSKFSLWRLGRWAQLKLEIRCHAKWAVND